MIVVGGESGRCRGQLGEDQAAAGLWVWSEFVAGSPSKAI